MCQMISILVDKAGKVYAVDGEHSHSRIAERCGVNEDKCLKYEFILSARQLRQDFDMDGAPFPAKQSHDMAAQAFFDKAAGTPEALIAFVRRGNWKLDDLLPLLTPAAWKVYDEAEAQAWKVYNEAVAPAWKVYNEAVAAARKVYDEAVAAAGKVYNEAVAAAGKVYDEAEAAAWKVYNEAVAPARKVYDKAEAAARKVYDEAEAQAWLALFADPKNRIPIWRQ